MIWRIGLSQRAKSPGYYPRRPDRVAFDGVHDAIRYRHCVTEVRSHDQEMDLVRERLRNHLYPFVVYVLMERVRWFAGMTEGVMPIDHRGFPKQQNIV